MSMSTMSRWVNTVMHGIIYGSQTDTCFKDTQIIILSVVNRVEELYNLPFVFVYNMITN